MIRQHGPDLPLKLLLIIFARFVNRDPSRLMAYLVAENRVFRELQGKKRLILTDHQLRLLAAKDNHSVAALPGRIATLVTPDTIRQIARTGELRILSQRRHRLPQNTGET